MRATLSRSVQILLPVMLTLLLIATFTTNVNADDRQFTIDPIERETTPILATTTTSYEDIKLHGSVLTDQINQVRSPDVIKKYLLYKVADTRAYERAIEKDQTGTSEFDHDLDPVLDALDANGICYHYASEVVGFSNTLRTSPPAATADDIVDKWEASPNHNGYIKDPDVDWGGGGWVRSDSGTYFFAFYLVDICGI
jgi:hypothetical protein